MHNFINENGKCHHSEKQTRLILSDNIWHQMPEEIGKKKINKITSVL